jgi:hypothetical protein
VLHWCRVGAEYCIFPRYGYWPGGQQVRVFLPMHAECVTAAAETTGKTSPLLTFKCQFGDSNDAVGVYDVDSGSRW